jgi:hypothetical protein
MFGFVMKVESQRNLYLQQLIWIHTSNAIQYEFTFYEYLRDDDPSGSKHVANIQINKFEYSNIDLLNRKLLLTVVITVLFRR